MKYGGKKNIPPDVVFGAMRESMERMNINLKQALNHMSDDLSEEDKKEVTELLREAANLEDEANRLDTRHHIEQAAQDREQK
jgi:predicted phosphoribosyltransferase